MRKNILKVFEEVRIKNRVNGVWFRLCENLIINKNESEINECCKDNINDILNKLEVFYYG